MTLSERVYDLNELDRDKPTILVGHTRCSHSGCHTFAEVFLLFPDDYIARSAYCAKHAEALVQLYKEKLDEEFRIEVGVFYEDMSSGNKIQGFRRSRSHKD